MKQHLEIEYKMLLSKRQFLNLQKKYPFDFPMAQTNYYYDTPNKDLHAKRYALRIRQVGQELILTLKIPQKLGVMEYEQTVTSLNFQDIALGDAFQEVLSFIDCSTLSNFGQLTTYRQIFELADATLCLDENFYHKHHDYEIEYEVKQNIDANPYLGFLSILEAIGILRHKPAMGKAMRVKKAIKFSK